MNAKDQLKVISAGFTIIREREVGITNRKPGIAMKSSNCREWYMYPGGFDSKAGRRRVMDDMLKNPKVVED